MSVSGTELEGANISCCKDVESESKQRNEQSESVCVCVCVCVYECKCACTNTNTYPLSVTHICQSSVCSQICQHGREGGRAVLYIFRHKRMTFF